MTSQSEIQQVFDQLAAGFKRRNLDDVLSVYSVDVFAFDLDPPRQHVGRDSFGEKWAHGFESDAQIDITDIEITAVGDFAYCHYIYALSMTGPDGNQFEINARATNVMRKETGCWQIVQEHISVPVDLVTGQPDFSSQL